MPASVSVEPQRIEPAVMNGKYKTSDKPSLTLNIKNTQPLPASNLTATTPDGTVKLRMGSGLAAKESKTLHSSFAETVNAHPNHRALAYLKDTSRPMDYSFISYKQYYDMACLAAKGFIQLGLEPQRSVGILGFNSAEWFISYWGAIFSGGFACGVYTTNTAETCEFVLSDSQSQIVVVENKAQLDKILSIRDNLPHLKAIIQYKQPWQAQDDPMVYTWEQLMTLGREAKSDDELISRLSNQAPNQCCSLIYTSGTTGKPKGVMLSHDNLTWTASFLSNYIPFNQYGDIAISYLPLSHIAAQLCDIVLTSTFRCTVYFAQPDALKGSLGTTLKNVRPTIFLGVPRVWEKMMEKMREVGRTITGVKRSLATWAKGVGFKAGMAQMNNESKPWGFTLANGLVLSKVRKALGLDRCHLCVTAAAPITKETLDYFLSLGIPLLEMYGMSESTGPHTLSIPNQFRLMSVGKTPPGVQTKLDKPDEDGNGEVCMFGRHVFMGYLNAEKQTAETIDEEGWLHSGDLGKFEDDFLFITGRIKELLITAGGENIAPVPVEDLIKFELPCVSNAMLIGDKKKFLCLFITLKTLVNDETMEPLDELAPPALRWMQDHNSSAKTVSEIIRTKDPVVYSAIQAAVTRVNAKAVSRAAVVQKWVILPVDFSIPGGELGPTLKVRRPIITKQYTETIEEFYQE